ncbi:MAG: hypothetical protein IT252_09625 [Chitinophagaceae bacterium]|nr:hypothetical protein [Chitinophagaceae bacterium]
MRKHVLLLAIVLLAITQFSTAQPANFLNSKRQSPGQIAAFSDAWSFTLSAGAAFPTQKGEASLFMNTGLSSKFSSQYFFGKVGLGLSAGMIHAAMDNTAIKSFMQANKFPDNATFTSTSSLTSYWLAGPSFRMGNRIQILGEIRGGIFQNKAGSLNITAPGVTRSLYRFETGEKTSFPGWSGNLSVAYPLGATTAISINTDYLQSSSAIRLIDPRQGIDVATLQTKKWQVFTAGISFVKTFGSSKSVVKPPKQSGLATGKRSSVQTSSDVQQIPDDVSIINPEASRSLKTRTKSNQTNERTFNTNADDADIMNADASRVLKTKTKSNQSNDRMSNANCGPVTIKNISPDGTVEEQTFSCPDDALAYARKIESTPARISTNRSVPKQTQGATFGEKVNQGLHAAGGAIAQGSSIQPSNSNDAGNKNILYGKIVHAGSGGQHEIVTNRISGGAGGGAAAASYAATGMVVAPTTPTVFAGPVMNIYARESSSGMATGKRSRDAGSGMATGRRTYQPIMMNDIVLQDACTNCNVKASNPLYNGNNNQGNNPMHEKSAGTGRNDDDCDGLAEGFTVSLFDMVTNSKIATTTTDHCGAYWFANLPTGNYAVQVEGYVASNKNIPFSIAGKDAKDIAGVAFAPEANWHHIIYQSGNAAARGKVSMQDISIIAADSDGDGFAETFRTIGNQSDGSSKDFSNASAAKSSGGGSGKASMSDLHFVMPAQSKSGGSGKASLSDLHFTKNAGSSEYKATATFSDGSTQDISKYIEVQQQAGLLQITSKLADTDGDGFADLIWSPRSNVSISAKSAAVLNAELPAITFQSASAFTDALQTNVGDLDGDGIPEIIAGNNGAALLGGAIPGGAVISAALRSGNPQAPIVIKDGSNEYDDEGPSNKPGTPIGGIIVKGGKNPGGNLFAKSLTNNLGEFEMQGLEPGEYVLMMQSNYVISDTKFIEWRDDDSDDDGTAEARSSGPKVTASQNTQSLRVSNAPTTKAQDHNSTRSNKTASRVDDGGGNGGNTKAQDHNSTRSNKTASIAGDGNTGNNADGRKGDVKITASQNSQSLRIVSADADMDGDGIFETDVTTKVYDDIVVNEKGETVTPTQRTGISTSRSNIRNKTALLEVGDGVYLSSGSATIGNKTVPVKMVYKKRVGGIFKGD